jgi:hypothetical protein
MNIEKMGIEEAEMYARFAQDMAHNVIQSPTEANQCAVVALIDVSRRIMNRLIAAEFSGRMGLTRDTAQAETPVISEAPEPSGETQGKRFLTLDQFDNLALNLERANGLASLLESSLGREEAPTLAAMLVKLLRNIDEEAIAASEEQHAEAVTS